MNPITMLFIVALLVAIWWLVRKRREAVAEDEKTEVRTTSRNSQFHAVSIKFTGRACQAAKDMSGRRFLATAAPKLPLPQCDVLDCTCRFTHHTDRRAGRDRRSPFGAGGAAAGTGAYDSEQRAGNDRRKNND
ncbi:MAG: hypothetical protein ACR2QT_01395 [Woeseiaceae bacterium]